MDCGHDIEHRMGDYCHICDWLESEQGKKEIETRAAEGVYAIITTNDVEKARRRCQCCGQVIYGQP